MSIFLNKTYKILHQYIEGDLL